MTDQQQQPPPPSNKSGCAFIAGLIGALLAIAWIWGAIADDGGGGDDTLAEASCRHFANIANDARMGVLGADQLVPKMQEVWRQAQYADDYDVREGARSVLAALNLGDVDGLGPAIDDLVAACAPHLAGG